ncbi:FAD-dependent tricarballylate dehydrogenase TcuA [Helicobacter sp. 11S02596-1]|uniref:FAD-dependent tricarballylate dehydrogenase TcuA n=1 Tax=Helicobacter sp. 11S02596-1 TaxID=1476194 RepID=UPI000BA68849|nr:FAD-dependent tricarballylate dehydrogenase TcuA [Helicobacter sp. 11S02596-1]PAF44024.1 FAD-binding dehydrogenase [Helicobacter sp. 11S02596-1]
MERLDCDVLVIGGGNAALCAALSARQKGASVLILESAPKDWRGGNSQHTRNLRSMHTAPTDVLSGSYSEDEFYQDVYRVSEGETNEEYARFVISQTPHIVEWAKSCGVRFQPSLGGTLQLGRTNAFFLGGGKALLNAYYHQATRLGIEVAYECEALDLSIQENSCAYVLVLDKKTDDIKKIKAKSYVIASGGFESNLAWLKEAWGEKADNFLIRGSRFNQGKMLQALKNQGAKILGNPTQGHMVAIDARAPKYDGGIVSRVDCVSLGVVVNKNAQRFYDEGEDFWPKRYAIWGRLVANQPDQIAYCITDSKVLDKYMPSLFPPVVASSVAEIASEFGLDQKQLEKTLSDYNNSVVAGDFDHTILDGCRTRGLAIEKTHWAQKIDTPPFYCYPLRPGITFTYLGVKVSKDAQVIKEDGNVCKNLFAAGEIMAGNILSKGYVAGFGMAIGSVFGKIAGENAANYSKEVR